MQFQLMTVNLFLQNNNLCNVVKSNGLASETTSHNMRYLTWWSLFSEHTVSCLSLKDVSS